MKFRKSISILLVVALIFSCTVQSFALTDNVVIQEGDINTFENVVALSSFKEENIKYIYEGSYVDVHIPKKAKDSIIIKSDTFEPIGINLPDIVSGGIAEVEDDGTIYYISNDSEVVFTTRVMQEKFGEEIVDYVRTNLSVDKDSLATEMQFDFNLPANYKLISAESYNKIYAKDNQNEFENIEKNKECCLIYITDSEGTIINTIEFLDVKDAKGNAVDVDYTISDKAIIQNVNIIDSNEFPLTIVMSSYAPIWKYNKLELGRSSENAEKAKTARRDINARQNSTLATFCSLMTSLFSLLPVLDDALSYSLTLIDSVYGGISNNLERQEDMYTLIYEVFTSTAALEKSITKVIIVYPLYGTYQGKNKGYRYQQRDEYAQFYNSSGQQIDSSQFA